MQLCSYSMKHDYGFAPNPFGGYCTLAACTPNHQNAKVGIGDWIMGNSATDDGSQLIYVMEISETLGFDEYYRDERFQQKKPRRNLTWRERCGDNIYFRRNGVWRQHRHAQFHVDDLRMEKDLAHPTVFISDHFYYFGENRFPLPLRFRSLARVGRGIKRNHDERLVARFVEWLKSTYEPGIHGDPRDIGKRDDSDEDECKPINCH